MARQPAKDNAPGSPGRPEGVNYRRVTWQLGLMALVLAVGSGGLSYALAGSKGLVGALIGAGVVGLFFASSGLVMHLSKTPEAQARNLLVSWFAKMIVLLVVMMALKSAAFISRPALGLTIVAGVIGSLILEGRVVWAARLPPGEAGQRLF